MSGQITEEVKHERSSRLLCLNKTKKREFEDRHIMNGKLPEVLFEDMEEARGKQFRTGYTREYIKVYDGSGKYHSGDIVNGTMERQGDLIIFKGK